MLKFYAICVVLVSLSFKTKDALIQYSNNDVYNAIYLNDFFKDLDELAEYRNSKVSIVHIGDSHIQADFLTGRVRTNFQNTFGNAGRGFVFPYKIANSGGALDVVFKHSGNWQYCDVMRNYSGCEIGAAGFSVSAFDSSTFAIDVVSKAYGNSNFNLIKLLNNKGYFVPSRANGLFSISNSNSNTQISFEKLQDSVEFSPQKNEFGLTNLFGLVLENSKPGVLYHAMGVNGSSTLQYLRSTTFENDIAQLSPNLIIISFGTNDCYIPASSFCKHCVKARYKTMISRIKTANPNVPILLTTPPDHFYFRKKPNKNTLLLLEAMYEIAEEDKVAIWDLHRIMGGVSSIKQWHEQELARGDLIHFTKEGYNVQGDLLYNALMFHYLKTQ